VAAAPANRELVVFFLPWMFCFYLGMIPWGLFAAIHWVDCQGQVDLCLTRAVVVYFVVTPRGGELCTRKRSWI
jgi:hypothetical protein